MTLAYGSPNRTRRTPWSIPRVWAIRLAALHRPIVFSTARESWRLEARQVGRVGFRGRDSSDVIISAKRSTNSDRSWPRTADSRIGLSAGARLPFQVIEVEDDRGVLDRRLLPDEVAGVDDYGRLMGSRSSRNSASTSGTTRSSRPRSGRRSRLRTCPDKCPDIAGRGLPVSATGATESLAGTFRLLAASGLSRHFLAGSVHPRPWPAHPASRTIVLVRLDWGRLSRCPRGLAPGGRQ
jgi:hypothetical protein